MKTHKHLVPRGGDASSRETFLPRNEHPERKAPSASSAALFASVSRFRAARWFVVCVLTARRSHGGWLLHPSSSQGSSRSSAETPACRSCWPLSMGMHHALRRPCVWHLHSHSSAHRRRSWRRSCLTAAHVGGRAAAPGKEVRRRVGRRMVRMEVSRRRSSHHHSHSHSSASTTAVRRRPSTAARRRTALSLFGAISRVKRRILSRRRRGHDLDCHKRHPNAQPINNIPKSQCINNVPNAQPINKSPNTTHGHGGQRSDRGKTAPETLVPAASLKTAERNAAHVRRRRERNSATAGWCGGDALWKYSTFWLMWRRPLACCRLPAGEECVK